jgi:TonB family protein
MFSSPAAVGAPATAPCALHVKTVVSVDEKVYAVILRSNESANDVHVTLYSDANDYVISLPSLRFEPNASVAGSSPFAPQSTLESAPIFVVLPKADLITGARVELSDATLQRDQACFATYAYTDFYQQLVNPSFARSAEARALKVELAHAYVRGAPTVTALATIARTSMTEKDCPIAASRATTMRPAMPDYPSVARAAGVTGTVQVFVRLDASGNVVETGIYKSSGNATLDAAARRAAQDSSYSPEIYRCEPIPGTYLFRADFAGVRRM